MLRSEIRGVFVAGALFVLVIAACALNWSRFDACTRFYVLIFAAGGTAVLVTSESLKAICRKLSYFGWILVGFGTFTTITGYSIEWQQLRVVERSSGVIPMMCGAAIVLLSAMVRCGRKWP